MVNLLEKIKKYSKQDIVPMHMPGHKRNTSLTSDLPYSLDISEIDGFDNLHYSSGILAELASDCATLYGSEHAFPLVNGSTCGIHAAIRTATKPGDKVIVARNCHKSVYHAFELNQLQPIYLQPSLEPSFGINTSINPQQIANILAEQKNISLIIITSPTYEGVVSDIKAIANIAHQSCIPLLVDAAHGAHLGFSESFPKDAITCGADMVVISLHKTLPALTQTAMLHLKSSLISNENIARELAIFESSSPSYILLASIDNCISILQKNGKDLFSAYATKLQQLANDFDKLLYLKMLFAGDNPLLFAVDPSKIIISTREANITGPDLANILRKEYKIEIEMTATDYIIAMTSIYDSQDNFSRFSKAIRNIDATLAIDPLPHTKLGSYQPSLPQQAYTIADARVYENRGVLVPLNQAGNRICLEYILAYPPAIPLLIPGEIISEDIINYISDLTKNKVEIFSESREMPQKIKVI